MKPLIGLLAFALVAIVTTAVDARADVTKRFCINGTSDGKGWTWELNGVGLPGQRVNAQGVPAGGTATDLAQQWVRSIQLAQGRPPAYVAKFDRTEEDGKAYFTITASRNFTFKVEDCTITGNPNGCSFNPTVLEVSVTGSPSGGAPWLLIVAIAAAALLILVFVLRRRRPKP